MKYAAKDYSAFKGIWCRQRELGFTPPIGAGDAFAKSIYSAMHPCGQSDPFVDSSVMHGGVFNLEFSPEGSLLVAACEKKSILIFDPLTQKKIHYVSDAHTDCVNCVKFLDSRMFATCSDDTTIALWDVRNLKTRIRTLQGHSNWVKNIEYSVKDKLLVTSGLDGSIYTWDINCFTELSVVYHRVFHAAGLMRCRISPDATQLIMCTTGGLLIIIHNLDLKTLAQDLHGFKPSMYRLMQMSGQHIPIATIYNYLFDRKRKHNRVEFISDFPEGNEAEVVSSLQIHPQGWCALSRNISHDDRSEWTCVHDIQEDDSPDEVESDSPPYLRMSCRLRWADRVSRALPRNRGAGASASRLRTQSSPTPTPNNSTASTPTTAANRDATAANRDTTYERGTSMVGQNDVWEALITLRQKRVRSDLASRGETHRSFNMQRITGISSGIPTPDERTQPSSDSASPSSPPNLGIRPSTSSSSRIPNAEDNPGQDPDPVAQSKSIIQQNKKRLLYYIEEPNLGKGFIKELCFSADGRLICSPYGYGVRLLSLSENCSELPNCVPRQGDPLTLVELGQTIRHVDLVVSSKFSPRHCMLVTGCLGGRIVWYQPHA